jgi:penicillin V acylase-like amidase (Ntn superfamily)
MQHKDLITDGMNEKGLAIGMFYHPVFKVTPEIHRFLDTKKAHCFQ